jgi:hypothetical protein
MNQSPLSLACSGRKRRCNVSSEQLDSATLDPFVQLNVAADEDVQVLYVFDAT